MDPFIIGQSTGKGLVGNSQFEAPKIYLKFSILELRSKGFYIIKSLPFDELHQ